jgi:hypothetical protein
MNGLLSAMGKAVLLLEAAFLLFAGVLEAALRTPSATEGIFQQSWLPWTLGALAVAGGGLGLLAASLQRHRLPVLMLVGVLGYGAALLLALALVGKMNLFGPEGWLVLVLALSPFSLPHLLLMLWGLERWTRGD